MNSDLIIIISESKKGISKRFLAAISYTIGFWYIFFFITEIAKYYNYSFYKPNPFINYYSYYLLVPALAFIRYSTNKVKQKQVIINLTKNKYRRQSFYGLFSFRGGWQTLPEIDYISIYRDRTEADFELQLWGKNNKRIKLFESDNWAELFYMGYNAATKLGVEFYNSLHKDDKHWVNLSLPVMELINNLEVKYKRM